MLLGRYHISKYSVCVIRCITIDYYYLCFNKDVHFSVKRVEARSDGLGYRMYVASPNSLRGNICTSKTCVATLLVYLLALFLNDNVHGTI